MGSADGGRRNPLDLGECPLGNEECMGNLITGKIVANSGFLRTGGRRRKMRLVDADTENERLLDFIAQNDSGIKYAIEHKDMAMLEDIFSDYFNGMSVAFDIDKVVKKIEDRRRLLQAANIPKSAKSAANNAFLMAVEDIKSGGIE